jgi:predicted branched-subunit amino acid permease
VIGAYFGKSLGDASRYGLDFAFAALFIAVLAGFWKGPKTGAILVVSSLAAVAAKLMWPNDAWYILIGGITGMLVAVATYREDVAT